jgi:hypothetical protein
MLIQSTEHYHSSVFGGNAVKPIFMNNDQKMTSIFVLEISNFSCHSNTFYVYIKIAINNIDANILMLVKKKRGLNQNSFNVASLFFHSLRSLGIAVKYSANRMITFSLLHKLSATKKYSAN